MLFSEKIGKIPFGKNKNNEDKFSIVENKETKNNDIK